ncbi:MAG: signal recognition particle-docking protein FtsY [Chlamydiales bacterium]|nr:signal recognition particle-docking protein FtsY [Chlamydiia bacterium]MCP5507059.1 signal recognition particle-docking protein FtsY [Chlamydiales bacterium]
MVLNFLKSGYQKVKGALSKTGSLLGSKMRSLFSREIDEDTLDQLEQLLYESDLGVTIAMQLTEKVRTLHRENPKLTADDFITAIKSELLDILNTTSTAITEGSHRPTVILIVGVNGSGKTTTIAKLAKNLTDSGHKVLLGAADTFRAAAIEQLDMWAKKIGVDIVKGSPNSDPAAVAFDAVTAAQSRGADVVIIDTAGRLHNKTHLMQELEKIRRSCGKVADGAPHETLLVLDANTGQNAIDQARTFHQYTPIDGLVLTKLDGNAKGGIVVSAQKELGIPIKFIGVGEAMDDLKPFVAQEFVDALFS